MKYFKIICFVSFIFFYACETPEQSEIVTIKLNPAFIVVDDSGNEPMKSKSSVSVDNSNPIYAIQIYEGENPIFYGLFDDVSKMEIPLSTTKTYKFKVAAYKKGTGLGLATDTINDSIYCYLPNKILLDNKFIKGNLLSGINLPSSIKLKGQNKDFSEVDAFYATNLVTIEKGTNTIDFTLLRMGFGILFSVDALNSGDLFILIGNDTIKLNDQVNTATTTRQFLGSNSNFETIYNNSASYSDSIQFLVKWIGSNGTIIQSQSKFLFKRNYQKSINIDLNVNSNNLSIEDWITSLKSNISIVIDTSKVSPIFIEGILDKSIEIKEVGVLFGLSDNLYVHNSSNSADLIMNFQPYGAGFVTPSLLNGRIKCDLNNNKFSTNIIHLFDNKQYFFKCYIILDNDSVIYSDLKVYQTKGFVRDTKRYDQANVFWNVKYSLFDLITDEIIYPDDQRNYFIYYSSNENPKVFSATVKESSLSGFLMYKFKTRESCQRWCDFKTGGK